MSYIYDLTDTWNAGGTTFNAIKMNVTDTASAAGSALIDLQVGGVSQFKVSKAGAVTAVGTAIPTISSTDTLSNKTLSSPTLSGTIAGSPIFSGDLESSAGFRSKRAAFPFFEFWDTNAGAEEKRWQFYNSTTALYISTVTDAGAVGASPLIITRLGTTVSSIALTATALTFNGTAIPTISSTDTLSNKTVQTVASTTGGAGLRIPSGAAPTSPVSGDIWYDGTNLKFQDGATTRTITWT